MLRAYTNGWGEASNTIRRVSRKGKKAGGKQKDGHKGDRKFFHYWREGEFGGMEDEMEGDPKGEGRGGTDRIQGAPLVRARNSGIKGGCKSKGGGCRKEVRFDWGRNEMDVGGLVVSMRTLGV